MKIVLSLGIRSTVPHPGRPHELNLIDTIVPAEEIHQIFLDIWPVLEEMLNRERPRLAAAAIDVAAEWLRIGGGHDHPFGQDHPQDSIRAAREAGNALTCALALREDLSMGNRARLHSVVERFDVAVAVEIPEELAIFFTNIETRAENWFEAEKILVQGIMATMDVWVHDDPVRVVERLSELKAELAYAPYQWSNRTLIAATRLAELATNPQEWLQASVGQGFMPEGCRFAERLIQEGGLSALDARSLLASPASRAEIIEVLLGSEPPPSPATELAAEALTCDDYQLMQTLMLRGRVAGARQAMLLTESNAEFKAAIAVAIFTGRRQREDWSPGELESAWLAALDGLHSSRIPNCPGYDMADLFGYLARHYPDVLTRIISRTLSNAGESRAYESLPHECWDVIQLLPASCKIEMRQRFQDQPIRKWLLHSHMVGPDTEWLEELLTTHEISPDEALGCYTGIEPEVPIEALAELLVPRGVDPERIAALRLYGSWSGNLSSWYQAIIDSFQVMSGNESPSVRAVAAAGIRLFTAERDQAARDEHIERVRGVS